AELRTWADRLELPERTSAARVRLSEEQRVIGAVAVDLCRESASLAATEEWERLRTVAKSFEARADVFDGSRVVISIVGRGTPTDLTTIAGRCALDLSEEFPLAKVALGVGRAVVTARRPRGEVNDEVIALLATAEAGRVRVDERAASALATHFRVVFG